MKRILLRTLLICMLAMLCVLLPVLLDIDLDNNKSLLPYLASNQYIGRWVGFVGKNYGVSNKEPIDRDNTELYAVTIDHDGIMLLDKPDESTAYELQKIDGGIAYYTNGNPDVACIYDGRLVLRYCDGMDNFCFTPCQDPIGTWAAVLYEFQGRTFPAEKLFADGCTLTLDENGTGSATIDGKQTVNLHMQYQGGAFDGGGVFFDPRWDAQKGVLMLNYGQDKEVTFHRRITAKEGVSVNAVPPYFREWPQHGDKQIMQLRVYSITFPQKGWDININNLLDYENDGRLSFLYEDEQRRTRARFTIEAVTDNVISYRNTLRWLQEITNKDVLDKIQIGGIPFSCADYIYGGLHYLEYVARIPESQMSVYIQIEESMIDEYNYQPILDSIAFTLPVYSPIPKDPPLPQDSTPYAPRPVNTYVGGTEVKAIWLPMDTPLLIGPPFLYRQDIGGEDIALHGDTLYALTGRRLYAMQIKDGRLVQSPVFPEGMLRLDDYYHFLNMTENGTLYVMDDEYNAFSVQDGAVTTIDEWLENFSVHPSGEWGICKDSSFRMDLVKYNVGSTEKEDWALQYNADTVNKAENLASVRHLSVYDDRVYVAGRLADKGSVDAVGVFDLDGKELFIIGSANHPLPDGLYEVKDVMQTKKSIVILHRFDELELLSLSGEYIGTIDYNKLLGTKYAEILSITEAEDGFILSVAQTRDDSSCTEMLVFHITGI